MTDAIKIEVFGPSFHAIRMLVAASNDLGKTVSAEILGRIVYASPGDCQNRLYDGFGGTRCGKVPDNEPISIESVEKHCRKRAS